MRECKTFNDLFGYEQEFSERLSGEKSNGVSL
jgi:hypothetical protein